MHAKITGDINMIKLGIERKELWFDKLKDKRVGLLTNPTGVDHNLVSSIDILHSEINLVKLFSPEHGIRGDIQAGEKVSDYIDEKTGIKVCTLYGDKKIPTEEMLSDIDVFVFDIQDVGSRLYTYIYSMSYVMQACGKYGKEVVIMDRPNPVGGVKVEGGYIEPECLSFVGLHPIPYRYGLTIGETARLFQGEFGVNCNLTVIPMEGWSRDMYYDQTGLPWVMPSPNMPTLDTAIVYNATCLYEGTNISEGRGTTKPFELVGAPFIKGNKLAEAMNRLNLPGVVFRPAYFTPTFSKHEGKLCGGVQLHVTDRDVFEPVRTGLFLLKEVKEQSGGNFEYLPPLSVKIRPMIDLNTGSDYIRTHDDFEPLTVYGKWQKEALEFIGRKEKYHLY